jgi:hypothetical protein
MSVTEGQQRPIIVFGGHIFQLLLRDSFYLSGLCNWRSPRVAERREVDDESSAGSTSQRQARTDLGRSQPRLPDPLFFFEGSENTRGLFRCSQSSSLDFLSNC